MHADAVPADMRFSSDNTRCTDDHRSQLCGCVFGGQAHRKNLADPFTSARPICEVPRWVRIFFVCLGGMGLAEEMKEVARRAKEASRGVALLSTAEKNACLEAMASRLEAEAPAIEAANARDCELAAKMGLTSAMLERLK